MTLAATRRTTQVDGGPIPARDSLPVVASDILYQGAMVCRNAAGDLVPAASIATLSRVVGVMTATADNSAGAAGAINGEFDVGAFYFTNSGTSITAAEIGQDCYAVDDESVHLISLGNRTLAGRILGVDATLGVKVGIGEHWGASAEESAETHDIHEVAYVMTTDVPDLTAFILAQDGVTGVEGELVLLANQTVSAESGVYRIGTVAGTAPLTRVNWLPNGSLVTGGYSVHVNEGTIFANTTWFIGGTAGNITIGTTAHDWYPERATISQALVAGTMTLSTIPVLSLTKSNVLCSRQISNTSTATTGGYHATSGGATGLTAGSVGTAAIIIQATIAAGTINVADVSTLHITVVNR